MTKKINLSIKSRNSKVFLQKLMTLFYKRNYLIHNLNVDFTKNLEYAKVDLVLEGDEEIFKQVKKQVYKIVEIVSIEQI